MAAGDGVLGDGVEVWLTNSSDALTELVGVQACNKPQLSIEKKETTDHGSGKTKTYIPGHGDVGELKVTMKYEIGSATDLLILEHQASREKRNFKLVVPEEDGTTQDVTGSLFILTYEPDDAPLNGVRVATMTAQPGPTITQAATV